MYFHGEYLLHRRHQMGSSDGRQTVPEFSPFPNVAAVEKNSP